MYSALETADTHCWFHQQHLFLMSSTAKACAGHHVLSWTCLLPSCS